MRSEARVPVGSFFVQSRDRRAPPRDDVGLPHQFAKEDDEKTGGGAMVAVLNTQTS
jgi:hypothetical protein